MSDSIVMKKVLLPAKDVEGVEKVCTWWHRDSSPIATFYVRGFLEKLAHEMFVCEKHLVTAFTYCDSSTAIVTCSPFGRWTTEDVEANSVTLISL